MFPLKGAELQERPEAWEEVGTLSAVNTQALVPHALGIARTRALTVLALRTQDLHPDLTVAHSYIYLQLIFQNTQT